MSTSAIKLIRNLLIFTAFSLASTGVFAEIQVPFALPESKELHKLQSAIIYTSRGNIYLELFPNDAPWHVANFKYLADKGFYRNLEFHLYLPNYVIQGGSPDGKPAGGPGYSLPAEFNQHKHETGSLGMARQPDYINPQRRSNGSQFHIILSESPQMDGSYTLFGKIIKGLDIAKKLRKGDKIKDIRVFVRADVTTN